jgi:Flp pilus assembly protein TadG
MPSQVKSRTERPAGKAVGFLQRLGRDTRGNVLAMMAAAVIPLVAFVGAGLDVSRAYLVRTRLQQACDAGVLAGRRMMGANGSITDPVKAEISKYVLFNFPPSVNQTSALTINPTLTAATDTINLTLETNMSTAIMRMFGRDTVPISVTCSARDDYSNIDIMLVLDTTGSMACKPERTQSQCSSYANGSGRSKTMKVNGRDVDYIEEETSGGSNISRMQALRDAVAELQSQMATIEAQFNVADAASRKRIRWSIIPFSMMANPGFSIGTAGTTLYARNPTWFNTTGSYRNGNNSAQSVSHNSSWMSDTWDGCVEERTTSNTITANSNYQIPNNLPSTAYDLMFDTAPTTTSTRWTVADPSKVGSAQYACPKAMREWQQMNTTDFTNYFKASTGFVANGGTYLDVGMLWAARMLSRTGMWASDNPAIYNKFNVRRYLIFMTDGEMDTGDSGYAAYAQERYWKRITSDGDADTNNDNHTKRWLMTCNAIKNMDVTIYAISFGAASTLSADMQACSSGPGYGYKADDADQLNQAFRDIGENIGSLRLAK